MTDTIAQPAPRSLADLIEGARNTVRCQHCGVRRPQPCTGAGPDSVHLARVVRYWRKGQVTRAEIEAVVLALPDVFTCATVVTAGGGR